MCPSSSSVMSSHMCNVQGQNHDVIKGEGLHNLSKEVYHHHQGHIINPSPNVLKGCMTSSRAQGDMSSSICNVLAQKCNVPGPGGGEGCQEACQVITRPNAHHQGCNVLHEVQGKHHQCPPKDHLKGCIIIKQGLRESSETNHHGYKSH
jgi:hypothetical protein